MVSDVLRSVDLSFWAEMALVLFVLVFLLVAIQAFFMGKSAIDERSHIPLNDGETTHG